MHPPPVQENKQGWSTERQNCTCRCFRKHPAISSISLPHEKNLVSRKKTSFKFFLFFFLKKIHKSDKNWSDLLERQKSWERERQRERERGKKTNRQKKENKYRKMQKKFKKKIQIKNRRREEEKESQRDGEREREEGKSFNQTQLQYKTHAGTATTNTSNNCDRKTPPKGPERKNQKEKKGKKPFRYYRVYHQKRESAAQWDPFSLFLFLMAKLN